MNSVSVSIEIKIISNGETFSAFCCRRSSNEYTISYPNKGEGYDPKRISKDLLDVMYATETIETDHIRYAYDCMLNKIKAIWGDIDVSSTK